MHKNDNRPIKRSRATVCDIQHTPRRPCAKTSVAVDGRGPGWGGHAAHYLTGVPVACQLIAPAAIHTDSTMTSTATFTYKQQRHTGNRCFWTAAVQLVLLLAGAANGASTGKDAELMAVGTDLHNVAAVAPSAGIPVEPVVSETKKVAGKASLMDGYLRTGSHKGDKGYNEDDVYGGKDSDSYGYGTNVAYGSKAGDGGNGAYHESLSYDDNGQSNPKFSAWHFEDKDGKPTKRYVFDSHKKNKNDPLAVEAEASEYDSVEAYDDGAGDDGGTHAGYEVEDAEPEYGALYDSADVYDADTYY